MNQDFPTDINDIRPSSIKHIIGQRAVVEQVTVALDAAQQDGRKFDHALLVGPPGCGKTSVSQIISAEMATDYIEVLGQSIKTISDLNALLLAATDKAVLFIDEAAELGKTLQVSLYLALDQRKVLLQANRKGSTPLSVPIEDFTLLLATTDEYQLLQPLRDRSRLLLRFSFYSDDELVQILGQRLRGLGWECDSEILPLIAERSRGTPRLALRLAQAAHRCARADGESVISIKHFEKAVLLESLDCKGCGPTEQKYLKIVAEGPSRLNVIASRLGLPSRSVSEVVEPYLIRSGLVIKDDQSKRQLTADGREHLSSQRQSVV
jgi:Holliday junction DNA helicase RuvB